MKTALIIAFVGSSLMIAAEPVKATAPVITSGDREPLLEAEKSMQADQVQVLLGDAARLRLKAEQDTLSEVVKVLTLKCGEYPLIRDDKGRAQCGQEKTALPAVAPIKATPVTTPSQPVKP